MATRLGATLLAIALWAVTAWFAPVGADEIVVPAPGLSRDRAYNFVYRPDRKLTGRGALTVEWTDVLGRVVERRELGLTLTGDAAISFALDLRRAVAMKNRVEARLSVDAVAPDGTPGRYEGRAAAEFIATPPGDPWRDYQAVVWQGKTARQYAGLKAEGISAGMIIADRASPGAELATPLATALRDNDLPWYVENIATDFYAAYHRYVPGRPVEHLYREAVRCYRADPRNRACLTRDPSLVDPEWLARVGDRLTTVARLHAPYAPLYFSLGDESGIADLSANWDFDFDPRSLEGFRDWLRAAYGTLAALNRQWGSHYARWEAIVPPTTTEAMRRRDRNYSAWSDFKEWMDESFLRAVRHGVDAVHAGNARARAALEGLQVMGWGGYDYTRLSGAVDLMEIYNKAGNGDIVASLAPGTIRLVTSFDDRGGDTYRLWRHFLQGGRGAILWDENESLVDASGAPRERLRRNGPQFRELRDGLGALLIGARPLADRIAVLYSPPSIRARWMLDHRALGERWIERDAEREYEEDTAYRAAFAGFIDAVRGAGYQPHVVAESQIARGLGGTDAPRLLILPHALALSAAAADRIGRYAGAGGIVIADIVPGEFDEHVKRRSRPILGDLFAHRRARNAILVDPGLRPAAVSSLRALATLAGLSPVASVLDAEGEPAGDVELYSFRRGDAVLLGLIAASAPTPGAKPHRVQVRLPAPLHARDLRAGRDLGTVDRIATTLDPETPSILALTSSPTPPPTIEAPARARAGETVAVAIRHPVSAAILRIDVVDPQGRRSAHYGGKAEMREGGVTWRVPFALNDAAGRWEIRAVDPLGGQTATARIDLAAP